MWLTDNQQHCALKVFILNSMNMVIDITWGHREEYKLTPLCILIIHQIAVHAQFTVKHRGKTGGFYNTILEESVRDTMEDQRERRRKITI